MSMTRDLYDDAVYDGAGRRRKPLVFPLEAEGLTCNVTATYTGKEAFRWYAYRLGIVPETVARGL
jgi:hypothetical protein